MESKEQIVNAKEQLINNINIGINILKDELIKKDELINDLLNNDNKKVNKNHLFFCIYISVLELIHLGMHFRTFLECNCHPHFLFQTLFLKAVCRRLFQSIL
jgi:hypothetical protein